MSLKDKYIIIERVISDLESSSNKGFLTTLDLNQFPYISELLPSFILQGEEYIKGNKSLESFK